MTPLKLKSRLDGHSVAPVFGTHKLTGALLKVSCSVMRIGQRTYDKTCERKNSNVIGQIPVLGFTTL